MVDTCKDWEIQSRSIFGHSHADLDEESSYLLSYIGLRILDSITLTIFYIMQSWVEEIDYETDLLLEGFDVEEIADIAIGGTGAITGNNYSYMI